jgi:hypothetical protein
MRSRGAAPVLAIVGGVAAITCVASAEVVERIPAVVDGRPVLQSDVRLMAEVRALAPERALEAVIDERLMYGEAARVPQAAVLPAEEERALARLQEERPDLRERVVEADLRRLVRRQLAILKYVEFRFRPQVRVTAEELEKAYVSEHGGKEDAPPFTAVLPALEERLSRQALDERLESWVRELRSGAEIRYNR